MLMCITADGAGVAAFGDSAGIASCCCCHRLQTIVSHVLESNNNASAAATTAQAKMDEAMNLNAVFRHSAKATRMLVEAQANHVDVHTGKKVVAVGCLGVAGIRWTGELKAAKRLLRILPFARTLVIGSTHGERAAYAGKVAAAEIAAPSLGFIIAILSQIAEWMNVLQSRSLPTYSLVLRMIDDVRAACNDIADWADVASFPAMEEVCSLFVAEVDSIFEDWQSSKLLKLAQLLDPRNADLLEETTVIAAEGLLVWGFHNILPRLLPAPRDGVVVPVPVQPAESASAGAKRRRPADSDDAGDAPLAAAAASAAPARRGNFGAGNKVVAESAASRLKAYMLEVKLVIAMLDAVDPSTVHPLEFYDKAVSIDSIKKMANAIFSIQASSAASESNFAQGRRTIVAERAGLQGRRAGRLITAAMRNKIAMVSRACVVLCQYSVSNTLLVLSLFAYIAPTT